MRCELTALPGTDGSAIFELGNTKVLAAVHGPRECRRPSERLEDRLLIKCEVSMAAFSTGERRRRTKGDRRTNELSTFVRGCLETCVSTELMARSQLDVTIQVLQADGGVRAAAINAAVLAIVDAGIPMKDTMAACSAGFLDDTALLDLNYMEVRIPISLGYFFDSPPKRGPRTNVHPLSTPYLVTTQEGGGGPEVHVAYMPQMDKLVAVTTENKASVDVFEKSYELALDGCRVASALMRECMITHAKRLYARRQAGPEKPRTVDD